MQLLFHVFAVKDSIHNYHFADVCLGQVHPLVRQELALGEASLHVCRYQRATLQLSGEGSAGDAHQIREGGLEVSSSFDRRSSRICQPNLEMLLL